MKTLPTTTRTLRCSTALLAMLALAATSAAIAVDVQEKGYEPTPTSVRPPSPAEEAAMRQHLDDETVLGAEGVASQQGETEAMIALGFNPDDPIARAAFRAESQSAADGIDAVTAAGDYILDTGWGTGGLAGDRYAGSNDGIYRGIKAARLSNGDVVVVGEVTFPGGDKQLGLTRRGPNGARIAWPNVDAQYSHFSGQYILYPNGNTAVPPIYSVHDVKVSGDNIYVLVTGQLTAPNTYAPNVLRFNANGSGPGWWFAYGDSGNTVNDAVAMDIYNSKLVVLGRHSLGVTGGFWTVKWTLDANGSLTDATFGDFPAPGGYDRSEPADIALRRFGSLVPIGGNPGYYVLFSRKYSADSASEDFDPCLLAVTGANEPDGAFASSGVRCMPFDQSESTSRDKAVALTTNGWGLPGDAHEGVQVVASVARSMHAGIGMWELVDRANHTVFGTGPGGLGLGRILFGGCGVGNVGEGCSDLVILRGSHTPTDLAISGDYMLVSGYKTGSLGESSMLAQVHGHTGAVPQVSTFASGYSGGRFNSLVVRDAAHVVGIGQATDSTVSTSNARTQIMTGLTNDDTIFENGFD